MAFAETVTPRQVLEGVCPVKVLLAEAVIAGAPLGISSATWVLSAHATAEQPLLIAGEPGAIGDTITAYVMAKVRVTHTLANTSTVGEKVALSDAGAYQAAGGGLPDVGFVSEVETGSLNSTLFLCPICPQLTVVRA